jgi:hypothetical protein
LGQSHLDILVNNAGIMADGTAAPERTSTIGETDTACR